jgi:hypothetical protein
MNPKELELMKELAAAGRQGRTVLAANRFTSQAIELKQPKSVLAAIKEKGVLSGKRIERSETGEPGEFEGMNETELANVRQATCDAQNNCNLPCNAGETLASVTCPSGTVSISRNGDVETASCSGSPGPALALCLRP